ncbi:MAG: hypothetical protein JSV05_06375 [Candidatus Bathyarchaeota archaeon]|nr:MAG: hypothetical protein JSV05_06375 [Candidatus Bathyarchaeota archaeon]
MDTSYSHQLVTGITFGLTTAIITSLGMVIGMFSSTSSKLAVLAGIIIMAIADGLSDSISLHMVEESEVEKGKAKHNQKEVWLTTLFCFLSVSGFTLSFTIPILLLPLDIAVIASIAWGIMLLILLNIFIAKIKNEKPIKLVLEHVLLAIAVIVVSYLIGVLVSLVLPT